MSRLVKQIKEWIQREPGSEGKARAEEAKIRHPGANVNTPEKAKNDVEKPSIVEPPIWAVDDRQAS